MFQVIGLAVWVGFGQKMETADCHRGRSASESYVFVNGVGLGMQLRSTQKRFDKRQGCRPKVERMRADAARGDTRSNRGGGWLRRPLRRMCQSSIRVSSPMPRAMRRVARTARLRWAGIGGRKPDAVNPRMRQKKEPLSGPAGPIRWFSSSETFLP